MSRLVVPLSVTTCGSGLACSQDGSRLNWKREGRSHGDPPRFTYAALPSAELQAWQPQQEKPQLPCPHQTAPALRE